MASFRLFLLLAFALLFVVSPAAGVGCGLDVTPAATLLVPHFMVNTAAAASPTTVVAVTNTSEDPALVQVVVWSDWSVPVLDFNVYLTGYDVQTFDLYNVLVLGQLPGTGSAVSPVGPLSVSGTFPGCDPNGVAGSLSAVALDHLQAWLTGNASPTSGDCAGEPWGDTIARGYVTIDVVSACTVVIPAEVSYWTNGYATLDNVLMGDYSYYDTSLALAAIYPAVHLEADLSLAGPFGGPTFYGRYNASVVGFEYADAREPLPYDFGVRYLSSPSPLLGTDLFVWREGSSDTASVTCGSRPSWWPLDPVDVYLFDEEENVVSEQIDDGPETWISAVAPVLSPFANGWAYLNLRHSAAPTVSASQGQGWVSALYATSLGYGAIHATPFCVPLPDTLVFIDGFESGNTSRWSSTTP